jgi:hypothetical protein
MVPAHVSAILAATMRLALAIACVLLTGCAAPPSDGGLWARTGLQQELVIGRMSDNQRAAAAHEFELRLVDDALTQEARRLEQAAQACPSSERSPLGVSQSDRVRDSMRVRIRDDPERARRVASQALADWYLRRARATGMLELCQRARDALAGSLPAIADDRLQQLGQATVSRNAAYPGEITPGDNPSQALVMYALGWSDTVHGATPLPEYLAAVYGGSVTTDTQLPSSSSARSPEELVDELAPAYPAWEPDAILQALIAR